MFGKIDLIVIYIVIQENLKFSFDMVSIIVEIILFNFLKNNMR